MKQLAFLVIAFFAAAAFAQDKPAAAPDKPAAAPEAPKAPEPMKEAAKPAPTKSAAGPRKGPRRWNEDARHCLERASNTEVIKCAEEFL
jgi:hypothetical protein